MSEKLITVTVPSYNAKDYLDRCLTSFITDSPDINQRIEVLIVNDGSTDETAQVAGAYVEKYPEMFRLINKENGGHGSGINTGIANATGKYFKIVDADDWVNDEEWKSFVQMLETQDTDIIASDYLCIQDETYDVLKEKLATSDKDAYGSVRRMSRGEIKDVIKMHSMTIKSSILQNNGIQIDEGCFYVDAEYITYPIPYVETVYYDKRFVYMYRLGRDGQSMDVRSMQKNQGQHRYVMEQMLKTYLKMPLANKQQHRAYIEKCIAQMVESHYQIYLSLDNVKEAKQGAKQMDHMLKHKYSGVYQAVAKKTIWMIRYSGYLLFGVGSKLYHKTRM